MFGANISALEVAQQRHRRALLVAPIDRVAPSQGAEEHSECSHARVNLPHLVAPLLLQGQGRLVDEVDEDAPVVSILPPPLRWPYISTGNAPRSRFGECAAGLERVAGGGTRTLALTLSRNCSQLLELPLHESDSGRENNSDPGQNYSDSESKSSRNLILAGK